MIERLRALAGAAWLVTSATLAGAAEFSEKDYFSELPEVLTVTRLAQPLNEVPGAVTVIDRDTIRRSGARELADVLRLVPGYLVGGFNGANPMAAYHAPLDSFGTRNLVQIDGRSVYSSYYVGDTHRGMMGILLEDIERIEVLRGANSAAYGANAMFGVINIITRHAADTHGAALSVSGGDGGTADSYARAGWGDERANFRLSAGTRADTGYTKVHDDKRIGQLHLRSDLRPAADQELMLAMGVAQLDSGDGFVGNPGSPPRTSGWRDLYLHGVWQRQLSATDQLKLSANYDEETFRDEFRHPLGVTVGSSGSGRRLNVELQHQLGLGPELRAVWGVGYKREEAMSRQVYVGAGKAESSEERLFGNLEWRPHPRWLLNAGGFWGDHSWTGSYFSPRLMANFLATPDHTLRAGVSASSRIPTLFELAADVRYPPPVPPALRVLYAASGNVRPEQFASEEIGYFGNFRDWRMTLDVRVFHERLKRIIDETPSPQPYDFVNTTNDMNLDGAEYQWRWKPLAGTEIWINQSFEQLRWNSGSTSNAPPSHATTFALFQQLPGDFDVSLMYYSAAAMSWGTPAVTLPPLRRYDVRLAKSFRIGSTRAEASVTVQQANGSQLEYQSTQNYISERRAFGTLRLEF